MQFCVNCGSKAECGTTLCRNCWSDPGVPNVRWDELLQALRCDGASLNYPDFTYAAERLSLIAAVLIGSTLLVLFSAFSLGLALLLIAVAIVSTRIRWVQTKASLVQVSTTQYPEINNLARLAAGRLRTPLPPVFVQQNPLPNAYATGLFDDSWIVLHSSLIALLTHEELLTVIGHEMGHIKLQHTTWLLLSQPSQAGNVAILAAVMKPVFNNWHIRSEFSADRAGLLASGNVNACVTTQIKLMSGKQLPDDFDLQQYIDGLSSESTASEDRLMELFRTHPYGRNRIKQILAYAKSSQYAALWSRYGSGHPKLRETTQPV